MWSYLDNDQFKIILSQSRDKFIDFFFLVTHNFFCLQMLQGSGLENLKTILQVQIVQKNAITSAVLQANSCVPIEEPDIHKG